MVGEEKKRVMDDLGNIIYILAAIGWFFWNAYKKSQQGKEKKTTKPQKRPQQETVVEVDDPFKSLEEMILEQLEGKKEEPKPAPVEVVREKPSRHSNEGKFLNADLDRSYLTENYQMSVNEGKNTRIHRSAESRKTAEATERPYLMNELFPEEGFDLRKAVVLQAILDRPYR